MDPFRNSAPDLNSKEGYLADFFAGGKQNRRKSSTMQRCAFGEGCRSLVVAKNMGSTALPRPSDFCQTHTCIGFQGEAPCFNRVIKSGVTRCIIHFQCTVTGCTEQRVGSPNGGWWDCCLHHQCNTSDCFLPRKYNVQKGRHFDYCLKHKCVKDSCERSHPSWQTHCTGHTCSKSDCNGIVEGEEKLCARHMKCLYENCTSSRVRKNGTYLLYCTRHTTCTSPQCTKDKKSGSEFCSIHTCTLSDCTKRCISNYFYCGDHICELDICRNPRTFYMENESVKLTRYCPIHECRKLSCHLSTRNQTYGYCREHNCDVVGCNNLKMIDPESYPPLTMCRKHYDESLDPPPPPRATPAPAPSPRPDAVTLNLLSAQLAKLQRTADNIEAVQRIPSFMEPGKMGKQDIGSIVLDELRRKGKVEAEIAINVEEMLREQGGQTHSLRQQANLLDSIWGLLVSWGRP